MADNTERAAPGNAVHGADFAAACAELLKGQDNLAGVRGITNEQLDSIFRVCYERYLDGDYDSASRGFQLLCIYDHQNPRNWQGYGYSLLGLKDYRKAATSLGFGSLFLDEDSPAWAEAHVHIAKALLHANQDDDARAILQELAAKASDPEILDEAAALNKALEGRDGAAVNG